MTDPVTTGQIYWGAVPFVVIQCIMVGLVIAFPQMVMHYKARRRTSIRARSRSAYPRSMLAGSPFGCRLVGLAN